jgi:hypothetical protein
MNKRKAVVIYTCSDFVHHQHRWRWSAWLCGRVQKYRAEMWALVVMCLIVLVYGLVDKYL